MNKLIFNNGISNLLQNNNLYLDFIFKNSNDIYWILDSNYNTIKVSNSILKLTGYTSNEFIELNFKDVLVSESVQIIKNRFTNNIELNNSEQALRVELISKCGKKIICDLKGEKIKNNLGVTSTIICLYIDYAELINLENRIKRENEKSIEANKFKSAVIGILSHEFKTPLSGIMGYTKLLAKECKSDDSKEMLDFIYQSAQRLNATLNSVTTLAALESEQVNITYTPVNIYETVQNVYLHFLPDIKNKNIQFEIYSEIDSSTIISDENCLYQIIYHLIDNSVKFTNSGKILIILKKIFKSSEYFLELTIQDTGIGIVNEKVNSIFEPFRQVSEGNSRKFDGLGIGLTITKKLVEKLNGNISVQSSINKGSVFIISFPII